MSNTLIWTLSMGALFLILTAIFFAAVMAGKEVPTGDMVPKRRPKNGGKSGDTEEYEVPNPDFDSNEPEDPNSNPRLIKAMEPVMETIHPNRGTGLMAMLAITTIVVGLTWALTRLNGEQDQTKQATAQALKDASDAKTMANSANKTATKAEDLAQFTEHGLTVALGTATIRVGEKNVVVPNYTNILRHDQVDTLLAGIDQRIETETKERKGDVARLEKRFDGIDSALAELRKGQTAAVEASKNAAKEIGDLKGSVTKDLTDARTGALNEIGRAVNEAKEAARKNTSLPASVIQPMPITRPDINLSYRSVGMFAKHSATLSYQATVNGRPDMATNIVALLEKFENGHNAGIVKGLEEAASKKQPVNKDKAILKLAGKMKADFNDWILGQWDFRKAGPAPQITDVTILKWLVGGNDEE